MFLNSLLIGISSSIDSLGIGITYGIKKTKISNISNLILFFISFIVTTISMLFGNFIKNILPKSITNFLGSFLVILLGIFMLVQAFKKKNNVDKNDFAREYAGNIKFGQNFSKYIGTMKKVLKNANYSDFDNSKDIDSREAIFLGITLSLDSFCIMIGSAMIGIYNLFVPLIISIFQILFLKLGNTIGHKIAENSLFPDNTWSIISGMLLITIGIMKLF